MDALKGAQSAGPVGGNWTEKGRVPQSTFKLRPTCGKPSRSRRQLTWIGKWAFAFSKLLRKCLNFVSVRAYKKGTCSSQFSS